MYRNRLLIIASTLAFAMLAVGYAATSSKWYQSEMLLVSRGAGQQGGLAELASQFGGAAALMGLNLDNGASLENEALAILRSRDFTTGFLEENNLIPLLYAQLWDTDNAQWLDDEEVPSIEDAYRLFSTKVFSVSYDEAKGLLRLTVRWKDRVLPSEWLVAIMQKLNQQIRDAKNLETERSIEYLEEQLGQTNMLETRQAIGRLLEGQYTQRMLTNVHDDFVFKKIDSAFIPDEDQFVSPNYVLSAIVGILLGFSFGVLFVYVRSAFIEYRKARTS